MTLSEIQQHLFNFIKVVHVTSYKNAIDFYRQFFEAETCLNNFSEEISAINKFIKSYDLEIVECIDELTCEKLLLLIHTVYDEISQKAKFYDKNVTHFFSEITKECIMSNNGCITETQCLNLSSNVGLTKTAAQTNLDIFIRDKWLNSKDGTISLGMRAIVELQQSIKQFYSDYVKYCPLCKCLILQGFDCIECNSRFHFACLSKLHSLNGRIFCNKCNKEFSDLPQQLLMVEGDCDLSNDNLPTINRNKRKKLCNSN